MFIFSVFPRSQRWRAREGRATRRGRHRGRKAAWAPDLLVGGARRRPPWVRAQERSPPYLDPRAVEEKRARWESPPSGKKGPASSRVRAELRAPPGTTRRSHLAALDFHRRDLLGAESPAFVLLRQIWIRSSSSKASTLTSSSPPPCFPLTSKTSRPAGARGAGAWWTSFSQSPSRSTTVKPVKLPKTATLPC